MKKFFSAFLLMAAMAFSVSTFVACNDVVGEIEDVKAQTTQNAANIEQLQADLKAAKDEAAAAAAAALQAAKDAQKAGDDAMAYAMAAEAAAKKALEEAIAEADAALQAHIDDFNTKYALINETLGQKADKTELTKAIADLKAELQTEISSVRTSVEELDKKIDDEVSKLNTKIDDNKKAFDKEIADLKAADVAINTELTKLNTYIETVKTDLKKEISDSTKALRDAVAKAVEEMNKIKAELVAEDARLAGLINTNAAEIKKNADAIAQNATSIADLRTDVNGLLEDVNDAKELLAAHAEDLKNLENEISNLKTQFDALTGRVDALLARVQSLTYVPDFNDHKAAINYSILVNELGQSKSYVVRETIIRYRVNAKAGQSAAEAAVELAAAWKSKPEILAFDLQSVADAATRSNEAYLQITKVKAYEDDLLVYVIAKNFDDNFFAKKAHYSTALVLSDGNNNISSDYANLAPGNVTELTPVILDAKNNDITGKNAITENLPYDLDPREVVVLENHRLAFTIDDETTYLSVDDLLARGYDIDFGRSVRSVQLKAEGRDAVNDYKYDPRVEPLRVAGPFRIEERDAESLTVEGNTYVTLNEPITKEQYLELRKNELNKLSVTFNYHINGQTIWTEGSVEITNRLVEVVFNVDVPWTFETALSTVKDGQVYAGNLSVEYAYDLNNAVVGGKSLSGYSLETIIKHSTKSKLNHYDIALKDFTDKKFTVRLQSGSEKYAFPVNDNKADTELVNSYNETWRTDFEDLTIAVKVVMNLGEQAPAQILKANKTFTPVEGAEGVLRGTWNPVDVAFASFVEHGYIKEASKAAFVAAFADKAVYATPTVNTKDGVAGNTNPAFEAGENIFNLYQYQVGKGIVDGTSHVIEQKVAPYFGIPYTFELTGTIDLGDYALDTDEVRVVNDIVNVLGEIETIDGKNVYTVNLSDLAKYYYVVNKAGVKELKDVNGNDNLTVNFVLSPMADTEETGFYFQGTTATEYTIAVDWNKDAPYILAQNKAVVNWGTYPLTEVGVNAILSVNGFPVAQKAITLVTQDPLEVQLHDNDVDMDQFAGDDVKTAKIYEKFVLKSKVEDLPNLFDTTAGSIEATLDTYKANVTYGASISAELLKVYYVDENGVEKPWDMEKLTFGNFNKETKKFDGTVSINPDDANIETPIYVKSKVVFTHNIHNASKESCETEGEILLTFHPAKK